MESTKSITPSAPPLPSPLPPPLPPPPPPPPPPPGTKGTDSTADNVDGVEEAEEDRGMLKETALAEMPLSPLRPPIENGGDLAEIEVGAAPAAVPPRGKFIARLRCTRSTASPPPLLTRALVRANFREASPGLSRALPGRPPAISARRRDTYAARSRSALVSGSLVPLPRVILPVFGSTRMEHFVLARMIASSLMPLFGCGGRDRERGRPPRNGREKGGERGMYVCVVCRVCQGSLLCIFFDVP
jgi:hypothetical protein